MGQVGEDQEEQEKERRCIEQDEEEEGDGELNIRDTWGLTQTQTDTNGLSAQVSPCS